MKLVYSLAKEIRNKGGCLYLVGGYVRDKFLGLESKDLDMEIFGISPSTLEGILDKYTQWKKVGKYEVYLIKYKGINFEISLAKDSSFNILDIFSIKKASKRRDLTINSIYYEPLKDFYIDNHKGIQHIKDKKLAFISEGEFLKDPLRILRVLSFFSRFNDFSLEKNLEKSIKKNSLFLAGIEKERIFIEISKLLLLGSNFEKTFKLSEKLGISRVLFPEILNYKINYKILEYKNRNIETSLLLLFFKLEELDLVLTRLSPNKKMNKKIAKLIKEYKAFIQVLRKGDRFNIKILALEADINSLIKIYHLRNRRKNKVYLKKFISIYENIKTEIKPIIRGRDLIKLGFVPNEDFSKILKKIHMFQLKKDKVKKEELIIYAKSLLANRQI